MKKIALSLALSSLTLATLAATPNSVTGTYVEARTAEVFAGACVVNSEGGTTGREALLAWKVDKGQVNGVTLDGLSVVAVVAGDVNLSTHEIGGVAPRKIRAALRIDDRATPAQRDALITLARTLSPVVQDVVDVKAVPIAFHRDADVLTVSAGEASLEVATRVDHSATCGAMTWYDPLAKVTQPTLGHTRSEAWSGSSLGTQWSMGDKRASFYGSFELK